MRVEDGPLKVLDILSRTAAEIAEGEMQQLMEEHCALLGAMDQARGHAHGARLTLEFFADSPVKRGLGEVIDFSVERSD